MSSRLVAELSGNLQELMSAELKAARHAVTTGVRDATVGLKGELRGQITSAGLGARLANTWRGEVYPKGRESLGAAGLVYSRAPVVVAAHDEGALIRSKNGFWLSIPLPAAGTGPRGKRITPGLWERMRGQRLRFVYRAGNVPKRNSALPERMTEHSMVVLRDGDMNEVDVMLSPLTYP